MERRQTSYIHKCTTLLPVTETLEYVRYTWWIVRLKKLLQIRLDSAARQIILQWTKRGGPRRNYKL